MMNCQTTRTRTRRGGAPRAAGFSLVELLAVILVISLLMTVGVMGIRNLAGGKSTAAAVANAEGIFDEARLIAVGKGTTARVLVFTDDTKEDDPEYRRRILVAYNPLDANGVVDKNSWELAGRGYVLPDGVYYSTEFSKKDHAGAGGELSEESFDFKKDGKAAAAAYKGKYTVYEFNSEGVCTVPGASFIVGAGVRPKGGDPRTTASAARDFSGFVVWRNGRTSIFRSPDQMDLPSTITTF